MAGERRNYGAAFKAVVALEAIRGEATIAELVAKHGVQQTVIHSWKRRALEEALARHGRPEIFNTDQGEQFTSPRLTKVLRDAGVKISMDGRGRGIG